MKTLFLTLGRPNIARNIFATQFWDEIEKEAATTRLIILIPKKTKDEYEQIFKEKQVQFIEVDPRFPGRAAQIITSFMRNALDTHTNLWSKMRSQLRGDTGTLTTYFKRLHTATLGRLDAWKRLLRWMLLQYGTPRVELAEIFEREKPDLVFVTGLTEFDFDVPIACEAKRRGIRLIGMTRSWDNFTSHGLTRVLPDRLVLQDEFLEEMAMRYQLVDPKQIPISIVGTPHYDAYFHQRQTLRSREEFFKEMQIDPKKRIVLYAAMGDFLFPYENQLADVFEELARTKQVPEDVQFIYRPHPKFQTQVERIRNMQFVSVDEQTAEGTKTVQQEMEKWELDHLTHLLAYSDIVLNSASTMALEGALFDKPVISIAFNGTEKNVPYWLSAERFFDCYTHFEDAVQTGSLPLAHSPRELAEQINTALAHPEQGREGRAALVKRFIAPYDGNSGLRLAKLLAEELRFLTVK